MASRTWLGLLALLSLGLPEFGLGQSIPVTNPSFEDISGQTVFNEFTFGIPAGWNLYDPFGAGSASGTFVGTLHDPHQNLNDEPFFSEPAPDGTRVLILFNRASVGGTGEYGIQQTVAATLEAETSYRLRVEMGDIDSGRADSGEYFDLEGFPGYRVELLADLVPGSVGEEVVLAVDDNGLSGSIIEGTFETSEVLFTTGAGHPQLGESLGIRLVNENQLTGLVPAPDLEVDFDLVRLEASPASPGAVAAMPLTVEKSTVVLGDLHLFWGNSCSVAAADYSVHIGTLGSFPSHEAAVCETGGLVNEASLTPGTGNEYFLVVPLSGASEGSYGRDSAGIERPPSSTACRDVHLAPACP